MSRIKEDCYWYKHKMRGQRGCGVLTCLQCKDTGICSFYETEKDYVARQQAFDEKQNNKIRIESGYVPSWARQGKTYKEFHAAQGRKN